MRLVTLIDLGAGALPAQTPAPARFARWFPVVHQPAVVPPVDGAGTTPVADGVLLEWDAVESGGAVVIYVIERSPSESGPWEEVTRTTETRYLYSDGTGQTWYFRITATVRGQAGGSEIVVGTPELVARQQALDQEIADRLQGDLQTAQAAAADATAKADAARDAAIAHADVIGAQVADILDADEWTATAAYPKGDLVKRAGKLYRALRANTNKAPESNPADWQLIGNYTSLGEAVAASIDMATQNASDIEVESTRLDGVVARMPTGTGKVASEAAVNAEATARANADTALAGRTSTIEGRMPTGTDKLANEARVVQAEQAAASSTGAVSGRVSVIEGRMPTGTDKLANEARVASVENASVTRDAALADRAAVLESKVPVDGGRAASEARVVQAEQAAADANSATSQALQQVSTKVDGNTSSVTQLFEARVGSSAVEVLNPGFESSTGWGTNAAGNNNQLPAGWSFATANQRSGARCLTIAGNGDLINGGRTTVRAGERFTVKVYARRLGPSLNIGAAFRISIRGHLGGAYVSGSAAQVVQWVVSDTSTAYREYSGIYTAPANIDAIAVQITMAGITGGNIAVDDISVERISATDEKAMAAVTNVLDVNGNIAGTRTENDGVRSSYSILATVFRVISSLTGMGMEWLDGYLRIWRGSAQLVLGHTFGSGDLVMWYGPNVGAAACNRSNGLFYLDTDGGGYFGGALSAGVLKNAVQTTNTATSGLELVNGPFSTNGRVRNVVVSYSRNHRRVKNAYGPDGFVAGAGSNTAVVQVYRKIGDSAETLWQTINVSGSVDIRNEPDAADVAISTWGGSVTVNDTSPSTSLVQYRAVLSAFTAQTVTHESGSFDSQTITQNLSIVSVEN